MPYGFFNFFSHLAAPGGTVTRVKLDQRKTLLVASCWPSSDCQTSLVSDLFSFLRCVVNVTVIHSQLQDFNILVTLNFLNSANQIKFFL